MAGARLVISVVSLAMTAARHPLVRAGVIAAAPVVLNARNREVAIEMSKSTAYRAGVLVRRITPKKFLDR